MYYASTFVSHIGLACILKTFVYISFILCFKNNIGCQIVDHNAKI